ncbi:PRC-barrel domain-containing protein [Micromonospora sp. NPDC094482]|uniref:PRC-barrel domain-containing protein n=1 Tax=unclassified Micromonospora TaxID=2617518 RepID=UPI0033185667
MRFQLGRQLLDRQLVDVDGRLVGKVDDIEFDLDDDQVPYVRTLLVGPGALGERVGGRLGRLLILAAERFVTDRPVTALRIPFHLVTRVDSAVWLSARADELPESPVEEWLRRHVIDRIPGSGHASG